MILNLDYTKEKISNLKDKNTILSLVKIFAQNKNINEEYKNFLNEIITYMETK
ncbi:hypothetical protein HDR60_00850 [bacterium]|nr:hypothetical protein [bacterium]